MIFFELQMSVFELQMSDSNFKYIFYETKEGKGIC